MPTFASGYVKPGTYLTQEDISPPAAQPGIRIHAPVGQGQKTLMRMDTLKRGATPNGQDGPLLNNIVIDIDSIQDSNGVLYTQGVDYLLTRPTAFTAVVDWSPLAAVTGSVNLAGLVPDPGTVLNGLYLNLVVNGGVSGNPGAQQVLFSGAIANPAAVAAFINAWDPSLNGVASVNGAGQLVLSANSIVVNEGTANAILGFTPYQSASVRKPAAGVQYVCFYDSDKVAAEYLPMVWTDTNKVQSYYGLPEPQAVLASGDVASATAETGSALATLTDTSAAWTPNQFVGCYLTIVGGTGTGQVRVIVANTANVLTLSQTWNNLSQPDPTSQYSVTNVNNNTITMGVLLGQATGATVFMTSQYQDDIYNGTNIQAAITALAQGVQGQFPYSIILMQGLQSTDTGPLGFLLNFVTTQSNTINNKWCQTCVGLAAGNDDYLTFVNLATGAASDRVVLLSNSSIPNDFGYGTVQGDGSFFAAAHAGLICANENAATPLLLRSIGAALDASLYVDPFLEVEKNLMAAAGVTIYENNGVDLVCRDALNTATATVLAQETQLTRSKDYVSYYLSSGLNASLVGQLAVTTGTGPSNVLIQAQSMLNFMFGTLQQMNILSGPPQNVSVTQDKNEPRQLDITADIYLTPTVKWVYILAGFGVG
jgi:hypothetical protein